MAPGIDAAVAGSSTDHRQIAPPWSRLPRCMAVAARRPSRHGRDERTGASGRGSRTVGFGPRAGSAGAAGRDRAARAAGGDVAGAARRRRSTTRRWTGAVLVGGSTKARRRRGRAGAAPRLRRGRAIDAVPSSVAARQAAQRPAGSRRRAPLRPRPDRPSAGRDRSRPGGEGDLAVEVDHDARARPVLAEAQAGRLRQPLARAAGTPGQPARQARRASAGDRGRVDGSCATCGEASDAGPGSSRRADYAIVDAPGQLL